MYKNKTGGMAAIKNFGMRKSRDIGDSLGNFGREFAQSKKIERNKMEISEDEKDLYNQEEFTLKNRKLERIDQSVAMRGLKKGVKKTAKGLKKMGKSFRDQGASMMGQKTKFVELKEEDKQKKPEEKKPISYCLMKFVNEAMKNVQCSKIRIPEKRKECEELKNLLKESKKDKCAKKKFPSTLDELYCYKEQYDETGEAKYRGQIKFLCRRNHCAPPDDVCEELNACRNLRPRFRDVYRESKQLYKELKGLLAGADPSKFLSSFGSLGGVGSAMKGAFGKMGGIGASGEQSKIIDFIIKRLKRDKKKYKKQYNIFKKTDDGKKFLRAKKTLKKAHTKANKYSKKERKNKKFRSEKEKDEFVGKIKENKKEANKSAEDFKLLQENICKEDPGERCRRVKDAVKFKEIDTEILMLNFVKKELAKEGKKKKKK